MDHKQFINVNENLKQLKINGKWLKDQKNENGKRTVLCVWKKCYFFKVFKMYCFQKDASNSTDKA